MVGGASDSLHAHIKRLQADLARSLDQISSREKYINTNFGAQVQDYKGVMAAAHAARDKHSEASESVATVTSKLNAVTEEVERIKVRWNE